MLRNRAPPMVTCHKEEPLLADISKIPSAPKSDDFNLSSLHAKYPIEHYLIPA